MFPICSRDLIYDRNVLLIKSYGDEIFKAIYLRAVRKKGYEILSDKDPPKTKHLKKDLFRNNNIQSSFTLSSSVHMNPP